MANVRSRVLNIYCEWDEEAGVWYVQHSDVPGLVAEAPTEEALKAILSERIPEMLELNRPDLACGHQRKALHHSEHTVPAPLELVILQRQRLRIACE